MVADIHDTLVPGFRPLVPTWIVDNHRRRPSLDNVDGDIERSAQGKDLGLSAPDSSIAHRLAILFELCSCHESWICRARSIFPDLRRKERQEVIHVCVYVIRGGSPTCRVRRLSLSYDAQ